MVKLYQCWKRIKGSRTKQNKKVERRDEKAKEGGEKVK